MDINAMAAGVTALVTTARTVYDIAKDIDNSELKREVSALNIKIAEAQDSIYHLMEKNRKLTETVKKLKEDKKHPLEWRNALYWAKSDPVPFCPVCYEADKNRYHLTPYSPVNGAIAYHCYHCNSSHTVYKPPQETAGNQGKESKEITTQ